MSETPPSDSGLSRAPFAGKAITRLNDTLETPLLKLVGKGLWLVVAAFVAVALYAGRQKLHEEISANPAVVSTTLRLSQVERAAAESITATGQLKQDHAQVVTIIDKVVTQQQQMTTQLAVVGEQIKQGAVSTDKLERSINRLSERLPARPGN